jgi:hypothetical protein
MVVCMALSARNQLRGQVKDVKLGAVMAHIVVQVGDNEIESVLVGPSQWACYFGLDGPRKSLSGPAAV